MRTSYASLTSLNFLAASSLLLLRSGWCFKAILHARERWTRRGRRGKPGEGEGQLRCSRCAVYVCTRAGHSRRVVRPACSPCSRQRKVARRRGRVGVGPQPRSSPSSTRLAGSSYARPCPPTLLREPEREHREEQDALLVRLLDRLVTGVLCDAERLVVVARHRVGCCGRGGGGYRGELVSSERERGGGRREESPPAARPSPCSRRRRPSLARFATNLARFSHSSTAHTKLALTKPRARRKSPCRAPPPSLECSRALSRALGPARTSYNMHCEGGRYKRGCERD